MRLATVLFFTSILTISLFAQNLQTEPFFSEDLNALSQLTKSNLKPNNNDPVRGRVVDFIYNAKEDYSIVDNKRDTDISISFWFLPQELDVHSGTIIGEDGLFYFRYLSNKEIQFNHYHKKDINTVGLLSDNVWQHLGFTLSKNGDLTIYYNGDFVLKDHISPDWWKKERAKLILGNDRYGVKAEGSIDRLKIWNRVLSESDFKQDFETSLLQTNLFHKLQVYLPFQGNFKDYSSKPKVLEIADNIEFIKDSAKGVVANFNSENSILKYRDLHFGNQITISSWVNPVIKNGVVGIAGNKDFSFRYKPTTQSMWFSVPMMFKTVSTQPKKNIADWVHLSITINYNHKVNYFINGELVDSKSIGGNTGKEDYLEIGKSLWGNTFNGQMSHFAVWSKALSPKEVKAVYEGQLEVDKLLYKSTSNAQTYIIITVLVVLILFIVFWFVRKNKNGKHKVIYTNITSNEFPQNNAIFLLDKFKALDKNGSDISHEFTPTLIRLFSLVLFSPRISKRHIGSTELSDILWETDNIAQQKNNRGTNMHRLRKLLKDFDGLSLNYENRKWKLDISNNIFIDTVFYSNRSIEEVVQYPYKNLQLCKSLKTKNFDSIILQVNQLHLEKLKSLCSKALNDQHWEMLQKGAALWLSIDSLSEMALKYQITALQKLNEKQLALNRYNIFASNYKKTLNETLNLSFDECMLN